jgi:alpha-tubulin suppressor-like RCC1 family protein/uncharacterized protein YjdB
MLRLRSLVIASLTLVAVACSDGESGGNISGIDPITISRVEVAPRTDTIFIADSIQATDTLQLNAVAFGRSGSPLDDVQFLWTTSDSSVAVVDSLTGVVTAVGTGTAVIKASAGKANTATVVVLPAARSVEVGPGDPERGGTILVDDPITPTDTLHLRAVARDEAGEVVPGIVWTWTSSDESHATVDAAGIVSATGLGPATISASTTDASGATITGSFDVLVAPLVQRVDVSALPARLVVSDTVRLTATAIGPAGEALGGRTFQWVSSAPSVATVDAAGQVVVRAPGDFRITATTGFVQGTAPISGSPTASATTVLPRVFTSISAGKDYTCGTISLDRLYCWGRNSAGTLAAPAIGDTACVDGFGLGGPSAPCTLIPKRSAAPLTIASMSTGLDHVCVVASDDRGYCWGSGASNGNGKAGGSAAPELVTSVLTFRSVSAGGDHACALTTAGAAWCWGNDDFGQLGNVKPAFSTTPIPVDGGRTYAMISAGYRHTCAILTSGKLQCWGGNESGQLGIGMRDSSSTPRDVAPTLTFRTVAASDSTTCALTTAGAAYCWGAGGAGQIGNGGMADALTPQPVAGGLTFTQIAVGDQHACGLQGSGVVYCWGTYNLREYSEPAMPTPMQLSTSQRFTSITSGYRHACGLTSAGTVWCWGSNIWGAFGDGLQALWRPTTVLPVQTPATSQ